MVSNNSDVQIFHPSHPGWSEAVERFWTLLTGFFSIGLACGVHWFDNHQVEGERGRREATTSLFMTLPAEIRDAIYEHLLEPDPSHPPPALVVNWFKRIASHFERLLRKSPLRLPFLASSTRKSTPLYHHLNVMTLVGRQFKKEFMDVYCRRAIFRFTLDASDAPNDQPFNISKDLLARLQIFDLHILATPGIVGAFDPREATGDWVLRDKVFAAMGQMHKLKHMTLSIQACGNQLWNPIWLWHFTSQAFKASPVKALCRIEFKLEGWTVRESNHLARNRKGEWEWRCPEGHFVQRDHDGNQPVKEFCAALYLECDFCDPDIVEEEDEA